MYYWKYHYTPSPAKNLFRLEPIFLVFREIRHIDRQPQKNPLPHIQRIFVKNYQKSPYLDHTFHQGRQNITVFLFFLTFFFDL
jgi:hypothetical protein